VNLVWGNKRRIKLYCLTKIVLLSSVWLKMYPSPRASKRLTPDGFYAGAEIYYFWSKKCARRWVPAWAVESAHMFFIGSDWLPRKWINGHYKARARSRPWYEAVYVYVLRGAGSRNPVIVIIVGVARLTESDKAPNFATGLLILGSVRCWPDEA
jgi:hypothetical protein